MGKKGKIIVTITIGIACFVLTMIIFMQFKIVRETDLTSIDTQKQRQSFWLSLFLVLFCGGVGYYNTNYTHFEHHRKGV